MWFVRFLRRVQGLGGRLPRSLQPRKIVWVLILCVALISLYNLWNRGRQPLYLRQSLHHLPVRQITYESVLRDMGPVDGTLRPGRNVTGDNAVHYIWFNCQHFHFYNLLSLVSAYRIMKPHTIYFHTDCHPTSKWWQEAMKIPTLQIMNSTQPKTIFLHPFNSSYAVHKLDVSKLLLLLAHGGVVMDPDVFILKSLRPLRRYKFVTGISGDGRRVSNSFMIAVQKSLFLRLYYNNYQNYAPDCLECNSNLYATILAHDHSNGVHTIHYTLDGVVAPGAGNARPGELETQRRLKFLEHPYVLQLQSRSVLESLNPTSIRTMDNFAGEVARYIYYGSRGLIADDVEASPWWESIPANMTSSPVVSNSTHFHHTSVTDVENKKKRRRGRRKKSSKAFVHPKNLSN